MWAGARANYGVSKGKTCFEVKIMEALNVDHLPSEETSRHVVRVGYSTDKTSTQLGRSNGSLQVLILFPHNKKFPNPSKQLF